MADLPEFQELKPVDEGTLPPPSSDGGGAPDTPAVDAPPTLRETLEAAAKEVRAKSDEPKTPTTEDRPRGPDGKFLPKEGAPAAAATPEKPVTATPSPTPTTEAKPEGAPSTAPAGPPPGWSPEAKAEFTKLPPAVQQAVVKREQEVSAGFAQYSQRQKEFDQVVAPRRQHYAGQGISDVQAVDNIWQWFEALKGNPAEAFPALAELVGYNLSTVTPAGGDPSTDFPLDPNVQRMLSKVPTLEQQVARLTQTFEQQQEARTRQELANFSKDKPHYEAVRVTMGKLMNAGLANGLDDAYQQAVRLSPEVQAEVQRSEQAKREQEAAQAALKTPPRDPRKAAVSVRTGAPNGAGKPPAKPGSVREELERAFADARG